MIVFKGCARCAGDLFVEKDLGNTDLVCLQCGYPAADGINLLLCLLDVLLNLLLCLSIVLLGRLDLLLDQCPGNIVGQSRCPRGTGVQYIDLKELRIGPGIGSHFLLDLPNRQTWIV